MDIEISGDTSTKKPNILEEIAYRDTWGKGADSFIAMIDEPRIFMRDLPTSVAHEVTPGQRKIAVKVVDIFGNDTLTIVEATV